MRQLKEDKMIVNLSNLRKLEVVSSKDGIEARVLPDGIWHLISLEGDSFSLKVINMNTVEITYIVTKTIEMSDFLITI